MRILFNKPFVCNFYYKVRHEFFYEIRVDIIFTFKILIQRIFFFTVFSYARVMPRRFFTQADRIPSTTSSGTSLNSLSPAASCVSGIKILQVNRIRDARRYAIKCPRALFLLLLLQRLSFNKITLRVELAPLYFIRRNARERVKIASGLLNSFVFSVALHLLRITIQKNSFQDSHFTSSSLYRAMLIAK